MEATSSPGWRSRRRASRPNFCSGHLYVGSSNSACPAHPPKSNSQPSPPTRKPTPSTVPPSLSRSSPSVLAEAQASSPGVTPKPPSLAAHVRATGRSHERHVLTASRTPRAPLQASIASARRSRPVVTLPGLRLPSTPWNLSPAQQPSGPIKHRPADATPLLGALWGFALSVGIKTKDPQQPLCSLTSVYSPLCPVPALSGAASGAPASPSRRPLPHPVQPPDWELHEEGFGSCAQGTRSVEPDPRQPLSKHGGNPAAEHPTLRRDGDLGPRVEGAAASRVLGTRALRLAGGICSPWARAAAQPRGAARRASHRLNEKVAAKGFS